MKLILTNRVALINTKKNVVLRFLQLLSAMNKKQMRNNICKGIEVSNGFKVNVSINNFIYRIA